MENQQVLFKGERMEELLRYYFLSLGYFVARGVKYKYETDDITDVDLFLYGRSSSLKRFRINVDIKNKKTPQTFERILWANGLMKLLCFDSCIVATTDRRPIIHSFGQLHNTTILDGVFLSKLEYNKSFNRIPEEDLLDKLSKHKSYKIFNNKDWKYIYELSKSRLLTELDYSGFNSTVIILNYFFEEVLIDIQKREIATRMIYLILSHLLIIVDYIVKDIAFLEPAEKEKRLSNGFKFGNLGKDGVDKIISMAAQIAGNKSSNEFRKSLESIPTDILKDFFSKNENMKNLFNWAKEFEILGYRKVINDPNQLDIPLKGIIALMLDYMNIDRRKFFDSYLNSNTIAQKTINNNDKILDS